MIRVVGTRFHQGGKAKTAMSISKRLVSTSQKLSQAGKELIKQLCIKLTGLIKDNHVWT